MSTRGTIWELEFARGDKPARWRCDRRMVLLLFLLCVAPAFSMLNAGARGALASTDPSFYSLAYDYTYIWAVAAFPALLVFIHEVVFAEFVQFIQDIEVEYLGRESTIDSGWCPGGVIGPASAVEIGGERFVPSRFMPLFLMVSIANMIAIAGFGLASVFIHDFVSANLRLHWWWLRPESGVVNLVYLSVGSCFVFPDLVVRIAQCLQASRFALTRRPRELGSPHVRIHVPGRFFGLWRATRLSVLLATAVWLFGGVLIVASWFPVYRLRLIDEDRVIYLTILPYTIAYLIFSGASLAPLLLANGAAVRRKGQLLFEWLVRKDVLSALAHGELSSIGPGSGAARENGLARLEQQMSFVNARIGEISETPEWPFRRNQFLAVATVQFAPWLISTLLLLKGGN